MPAIRNTRIAGIPSEYQQMFIQIAKVIKPFIGKGLVVKVNKPARYEVWTKHEIHLSGKVMTQGVLFAGLMLYPTHVGFYFYLLNIRKSFIEKIPDSIKPLWKGGTTFYISDWSEEIEEGLNEMLKFACDFYQRWGWLR